MAFDTYGKKSTESQSNVTSKNVNVLYKLRQNSPIFRQAYIRLYVLNNFGVFWNTCGLFNNFPICPSLDLKLSAQRNETETKQFQNCFKMVLKLLFQFHFVAWTVKYLPSFQHRVGYGSIFADPIQSNP